MSDKTKIQDQEDKLKKLREKTSDPKIKADIDKKLKNLQEPFNK